MTTLSELCEYRTEKIRFANISDATYISTENMLPERGGIVHTSIFPSNQNVNAYHVDDILVSNIRPYFKKIWKANRVGSCSNDVLVFQATNCNPEFLYYVLSDNRFFEYVSKSSKGTKMPRGDKAAIMQYPVPSFDIDKQVKIAACLKSFDILIRLNAQINDYLAA